ncbi:MAG TPA: apolipoprotein N-acyltransferase [Candidatus Binatia bacterium]
MKISQMLLALLSAALLAAPFLEPKLFLLAWFAFVPLFWTVKHARTWRWATFYGWLMGTGAHLIGFYWLVYTISAFGEFPYAVSVIVFIVYAGLQAFEIAFFALFLRIAGSGPLCLFPPIFWVALEFLFPLLFPWHVANSQVAFSWFVQSADLVGPYGASFIVVWFNAAVYKLLSTRPVAEPSAFAPLACSTVALILSLVYGFERLKIVEQEMTSAPKLATGAVQGNVDIDLKWDPVLAQRNLDQHRKITDSLNSAALVIWPESAIEFMVPENLPVLPPQFMPSFKSPQSYFIFGAKSFSGTLGRPGMKAFNTAFFTDAQGRILGRYHKQVLLAFGEYLPFSRILSWLPGIPFADGFTPGEGPIVFQLSSNIRVAPLICYEDLMPDLARKFVSETHANLLVNLTNDAWYGRSVGPWQHLTLARSRAIETRRTLLRVTNTGVTSLVNAKGEVVKTLPMFTTAAMPADVDILNSETYYVRFGDWFAWGMTIVSIAVVAAGLTRSIRRIV